MPSPFPGMDPYIESEGSWRNFHSRYVPAMAEAILAGLPERYYVRVEEDIYLHELSADERHLLGRPDAFIVGAAAGVAARPAGPRVTLAPPVAGTLVPAVQVERLPYLEVVDRDRRSVVTAVELLSPSNKAAGGDRTTYLAKREQLQAGTVAFVEIDLLRRGPRLPLDGLPACDYYAMVSRTDERPRAGVWPFSLRDPMPVIPIPLAHGDDDVPLDLRAPFDRVYDGAGYARYIYDAEADPPLPAADAAWAAERVESIGRR